MIDFKTQTKRTTKFKKDIININLFCNNFQFGIVTSKNWGDFEERKEPIITLTIEGNYYCIPMSKFIKKIKKVL